jgi:hypothetical protein
VEDELFNKVNTKDFNIHHPLKQNRRKHRNCQRGCFLRTLTGIIQKEILQTGISQTGISQTEISQTEILQTGISQTGILYNGKEKHRSAVLGRKFQP